MPSELEIIEEFKKRRADTWAASKYWLLLAIIGFVGGMFVGNLDQNSSPERWRWGILFLAFIFVAVLRLTFIVRSKYRCPSCGNIPMQRSTQLGPGSFGIEEGVALSPTRCSNCGVRLK